MLRLRTRQAAIAGLVLLFAGLLSGRAWLTRTAVATQAELGDAGRWLNGVVIMVDPGHGGDDPGAVVGDVREKLLVYDIATQLKQMLEKQGAKVVLTREGDTDLGGRIAEELGKRVALVAQHRAQVYVSIHANKDSCRPCWGAQTFYQKRGGVAEGRQLAEAIQGRMRQLTPTTRVPLPADYFVLRNSPVPSAVVEVGFLTDDAERRRLQDPAYQRQIATAVALGLADFLKGQVPRTRSQGQIGQ